MHEEHYQFQGRSVGTEHHLKSYSFGDEQARPHVYIQGGLHADEGPGMLVASVLCERMEKMEKEGLLKGRVTVVPVANPIGLSQFGLGQQEGRFDVYDGRNFNRFYPDLTGAIVDTLGPLLETEPAANEPLIRSALRQAISEWPAATPADSLRKILMGIAVEADCILDLHCDGEAEVHLYTQPSMIEAFDHLHRYLRASAVLVAEVSGDNPFDEAMSSPWVNLQRMHGRDAVPLGCHAATVELRGRADVRVGLARQDAEAIIKFLVSARVLEGDRDEPPDALCEPTPLAGSEALFASSAGLVSYRAELGQLVKEGEIVADIIDPLTGNTTEVTAGTTGVLYARADTRIAEVGKRLGKIAGNRPFRSGRLLSP